MTDEYIESKKDELIDEVCNIVKIPSVYEKRKCD